MGVPRSNLRRHWNRQISTISSAHTFVRSIIVRSVLRDTPRSRLQICSTPLIFAAPLNLSPVTTGSLRGDYCIRVGRNLIHGSDGGESAQHEIGMWFTEVGPCRYCHRGCCGRYRFRCCCHRRPPLFRAGDVVACVVFVVVRTISLQRLMLVVDVNPCRARETQKSTRDMHCRCAFLPCERKQGILFSRRRRDGSTRLSRD